MLKEEVYNKSNIKEDQISKEITFIFILLVYLFFDL